MLQVYRFQVLQTDISACIAGSFGGHARSLLSFSFMASARAYFAIARQQNRQLRSHAGRFFSQASLPGGGGGTLLIYAI